MQHLIALHRVPASQVHPQPPMIGGSGLDVSRGPAALNSVGAEELKAHVMSIVQEPPGSEPDRRQPVFAPFITNEQLRRVHNLLATLDVDDDMSGWGLQASLGWTVAALTGAPPPRSALGRGDHAVVPHAQHRLPQRAHLVTFWMELARHAMPTPCPRPSPAAPNPWLIVRPLHPCPGKRVNPV